MIWGARGVSPSLLGVAPLRCAPENRGFHEAPRAHVGRDLVQGLGKQQHVRTCVPQGHQGVRDGDTGVPGMGTGTPGCWGQGWGHWDVQDGDTGMFGMGTGTWGCWGQGWGHWDVWDGHRDNGMLGTGMGTPGGQGWGQRWTGVSGIETGTLECQEWDGDVGMSVMGIPGC